MMLDNTLKDSCQVPKKPVDGHRAVHVAGVGILAALIAGIYVTFSLTRYYTFRSSTYDLVIFDQAVRSYAHFGPGISIVKGVHNGFGPNFSVLGDHFSPLLATLAPLYWIYSGPQTLLVAQAVLFALAVPPLWIFTRRAFGGGQKATAAAYLACAAYGLSWPLAAAASFDFHEVAFAPVVTAVALERFQAGRLRSALIALAVLLFVKEDMGLLVAGIGCYLAVSRSVVHRQRLVATVCVTAGVAFSAFAVYVLIPAFGGHADYYWAYSTLGRDVPQAAWHLITRPVSSLRLLITPGVKAQTMLWLVGAFCFLPLLSPITLAAVPLLLERMLNSKFPAWWGTGYQYNAYLVVIFAFAAVDGAAKLDRWLARAWRYLTAGQAGSAGNETAPTASADGTDTPAAGPVVATIPARAAVSRTARLGSAVTGTTGLACAVAMFAVAVLTIPRFALGDAVHPSFYRPTARMNAAAAVVAAVPSGVTVEAADKLGPHLSARDIVLLWDGDGYTPPFAAPWVIADVRSRQFTFASVRVQKSRVKLLERHGYRIVYQRGGYVLLHRDGRPARGAIAKAAPG